MKTFLRYLHLGSEGGGHCIPKAVSSHPILILVYILVLQNLPGKLIDETWHDLKCAIKISAEEVVGYESRCRRTYWVYDEYTSIDDI